MALKILIRDLVIINGISSYCRNYYRLPIEINGCNVLYGISDDFTNSTDWFLGNYVDGKFQINCQLGYSRGDDEEDEYIDLLMAK